MLCGRAGHPPLTHHPTDHSSAYGHTAGAVWASTVVVVVCGWGWSRMCEPDVRQRCPKATHPCNCGHVYQRSVGTVVVSTHPP